MDKESLIASIEALLADVRSIDAACLRDASVQLNVNAGTLHDLIKIANRFPFDRSVNEYTYDSFLHGNSAEGVRLSVMFRTGLISREVTRTEKEVDLSLLDASSVEDAACTE